VYELNRVHKLRSFLLRNGVYKYNKVYELFMMIAMLQLTAHISLLAQDQQ